MTPRPRLAYALLIVAVIAAGLASRSPAVVPHLPPFVAEYAGDTLWAALVFLGVGFLFSRWATSRVAAVALGFAFAVEASQLYHAPWLDAVRGTTFGHLALGDTFAWSDLVCYGVGVAAAAGVERAVRR